MRRRGMEQCYLTVLAPICDHHGDVTAVVGLARDITERRKAEEELRISRAQLRRLALHVQALREEERALIAREIHDELGQTLTALKLDLSWLNGRLEEGQTPLADVIRSMSETLQDVIEKVRTLSLSLRPRILDDLGLAAAIRSSVKTFQERTGVHCEVSAPDAADPPGKECSLFLFRIFQELQTNVIRHAEATKLTVNLAVSSGEVTLRVEDNGRGITGEQIKSFETSGILGIRETVLHLGGEVDIFAPPGGGTTVVVTVPCTPDR